METHFSLIPSLVEGETESGDLERGRGLIMGRDHGDPVTWPGADHRAHQVPSIVTMSDPVTGPGIGDSVITDLSAASDWLMRGTLDSDWSM